MATNQSMHDKMILWAKNTLGTNAFNNVETVVKTLWSTVLKIRTTHGIVYLKQTPEALFVEVDVIEKCRDLCGITEIPEMIASDKALNCFLMRECGDASLRTVMDGHLNVDLLRQGLDVYKSMQEATTPHVDAFLRVGVPDWRLRHFPRLYLELVNNEAFLENHGLESAQIKILQDSICKVESLCQALSKYGVAECLNHSDFHDNNILVSRATKKLSIIDLGETAITHPFFSLAAFLKIPGNLYKIDGSSLDYQKLYETCFSGWLTDKKSILEVLRLINLLLPMYLLFAQKRFLDAIHLPFDADNPVSVKQHDKINKGFVWFIDNMKSL